MSEEKGEVYDAAEYLRSTCVVEDRAYHCEGVSDQFFAVVARVLVFLLSVFVTVRFCSRQVRYAAERQLLFRHASPQQIRQDVTTFSKIPRHVAFVLNLKPGNGGGHELLLSTMGQVIVWSLGAGSHQVTVYERTGALQDASLPSVRDAVVAMLAQNFGSENVPSFKLRSGKTSVYGGGSGVDEPTQDEPELVITLMSERDGRPLMARLAREYAAAVAQGTLKPSQITVPYVHEELRDRVGDEPDLLVTFGSRIDLEGFSPWHLRVTELFCLPDNHGVPHYLVFYRALQKFSTVKINLGS